MGNELLEKSVAEVRRARVNVDSAKKKADEDVMVALQSYSDAKFQMMMTILMNNGASLEISSGAVCNNGTYSQKAMKIVHLVRLCNWLNAHVLVFPPKHPHYEDVRSLDFAIGKKEPESMAAALGRLREDARVTALEGMSTISVRGYFFQFVNGKYEAMC